MKIYQVGGSVRDVFMGRVPSDIDYVVIGSTEKEMLDLGYKKVGADFPVFLHPETECEYALARTERKTGVGYLGFETRFTPDITLEEDLKRRDFTMNAMAWDNDLKEIIDPYNGRQDINNKLIRHVNSEAFIEDPVRILRAARFAARYNFDIHPETLELISSIAWKEIESVSKERVSLELQKALKDGKGFKFLQIVRSFGMFRLFFEIEYTDLFWAIDDVYSKMGFHAVYWLLAESQSPSDTEQLVRRFKLSKDDVFMIGLIKDYPRVRNAEANLKFINRADFFRRPVILTLVMLYHNLTRINILNIAREMSRIKASQFPDKTGIEIKHAMDNARREIFYNQLRGESS